MTFEDYAGCLRAGCQRAGRPIVVFASIPSTNDMGKHLAREYLREGRTVPACDLVAWKQTAGRGQGDHVWSSPTGAGIWVTLVRPLAALDAIQELPMRVGVGLHRVLHGHATACRLKWPNDLVTTNRKLGGVLIETIVIGEQAVAVLGFGINYTEQLDRFDAPAPASVGSESDVAKSMGELAVELIASVDRTLDVPSEAVLAEYREASAHQPGDRMRCRSGGAEIEGAFLGFAADGRLRLDTDHGEQVLTAAEIIEDVT